MPNIFEESALILFVLKNLLLSDYPQVVDPMAHKSLQSLLVDTIGDSNYSAKQYSSSAYGCRDF
ncbi:BgtTE-56121 [Blumeria graminis f. sp. tritici]|nr:BgtTE-56121 [Blumeria graminis f. sp. tritici]